jgi:hypothetical protein
MPIATRHFVPQLHNPALASKSLSVSDLGISWNHSGQHSGQHNGSPLNGVSPTPPNSTTGASPYDLASTTSSPLALSQQISSPVVFPTPCAQERYRMDPYNADVLTCTVPSPWEQFMSSFSECDESASLNASFPANGSTATEIIAAAAAAAAPLMPAEPTAAPKKAAAPKRTFRILTACRHGKRSVTQVSPPACSRQTREVTPLADFDMAAHWNAAAPVRFMCEMRSKCRRGNYVSQLEFKAGDLVVCDGDKGVDIGEVTACYLLPSLRRGETPQRAYRAVTKTEARHYFALGQPEAAALDFLQSLQRLACDGVQMELKHHEAYWPFIGLMNFIDVEMQADHGKMYVYFKAAMPIRFKPLAETLYAFYGCRIWLHQMDRDTPQSSPNTSVGSRR